MSTDCCIVCGKNCVTRPPIGHLDLDEAIDFRATGNYGSRIWDPLDETLSMCIFVCDSCIIKYKDRVTIKTHRRSYTLVKEVSYEDWDKEEYKEYKKQLKEAKKKGK